MSDSDLVIPFLFWGKEVVENVVGYTKLAFAVFVRGYLPILVHWCRYQQTGRRGSYWEENVKGGEI